MYIFTIHIKFNKPKILKAVKKCEVIEVRDFKTMSFIELIFLKERNGFQIISLLWVGQRRKLDVDTRSTFGKFWSYTWQVRCLCGTNNTTWCEGWVCLMCCPNFVAWLSLSAPFQKQRTDYVAKPPEPVPATPSPPPTPAPVPVAVPLPPCAPAPIPVPVPKAPAAVSRQSSTSSDSGSSVARDSQRQKQIPVDRKFAPRCKEQSFQHVPGCLGESWSSLKFGMKLHGKILF